MRHRLEIVALLALLAAPACGPKRPAAAERPAAPARERFHLGSHSMTVTTASKEAQAAFDRGLTLAYAFSHGAAEKEFREAARQDPALAMAWWGVALVNGPHINFPLVPEAKAKVAWEALGKAKERAAGASELERALIAALATRYADPQPEDRAPLDRAYAEAMRAVWKAHPKSADAATLFAEAAMDLRPWDLWTKERKPQPGTDEIVATLEEALRLDPRHPGASHLYVHAMEASARPARAAAAADTLRDLVPGASHLVHMPAHIDARLGRWDLALEANRKAAEADEAFRKAHPRPGFYAMYMAHNDHFYSWAATMQGKSAEAIRAARKMVAGVPEEFLKEYGPVADGYMVASAEALMRFGRWEEILKEPEPRAELPLSRALWRFTRAVALTALDRLPEAEKERAAFRAAAAKVPEGYTFGNNAAADLLAIAGHMLDGEMAAARGRFAEAERSLRAGIAVEDGLRYDEPPDWIQPVRHTLGAVLLRAGRPADAEKVYREDLERLPRNGWSLFGLGRALRLQEREAEAKEVERTFAAVWKNADVTLGSTCYCQPPV